MASQAELSASTSCGTCPLIRRTLYGIIAPHEVEQLRDGQQSKIVRPRTIIHRIGETPEEIYSVRSGWAFRFMLLPDGRRQILSIYLPGDLISLQALRGKPLWFSVQALSAMTLCAFNRNTLMDRVSRDEALVRRMEDFWVLHAARLDNRLVDIGRRRAIERMALLMLDIEKRFASLGETGEDGTFPFLLRQEHIADALGLTRVHVSRTFSLLRRQNVIASQGGRLAIRDRSVLVKLAGLSEDPHSPETDMFVA